MRIQEVCRRTALSKRIIHFYIKQGLLTPAVNPENQYYDFSENDCSRLLFIKHMRDADLPLSVIASMLKNPATAGYYLSIHVNALKKEQLHLEQTLVSLKYMLDNMPIYPNYSALSAIASSAGIPPRSTDTEQENTGAYNASVINQLLWAGFLPDAKLTEYQEYLWVKLNRISIEEPTEDYARLGKALSSMTPQQIEGLFHTNVERYKYIFDLTKETIPACAESMIRTLEKIVVNEEYIRVWKERSAGFFEPFSRIQASRLSLLVMEISPFYKKYVNNILQVCQFVYQHLCAPEGAALLQEMNRTFGDTLDLEIANHGILEALVSVPLIYPIMR